MLVLGEIDHAILRQLVDLAFNHPQRDVAQHTDDVERVLRERHGHRLDVEEVAGEHRDVVPPARVHGLPAAAHIRIVDDVVVNERGRVDELHDRGIQHGTGAGVAAQARGHQQHRRPHALAAALLDVGADLGDDVDLRLDLSLVLALDRLEVGPHGLEQLDQVRLGLRERVGQARQSHHRRAPVSTRAATVNPLQG